MKRLFISAKGIIDKVKDSGKTTGEKTLNKLKNILSTKIMINVLVPILIPVFLLFIIFLVIVSMFNEKINLLQMVDSGGGGRSSIAGKGIYTADDFEDAVQLTNSITTINRCDFNDFDSKLSSTGFKNTEGFNSFIKENVNKAGFGTREGVVAAAMSLAYEYPKATGYKYFYTYSRCPCSSDRMRNGVDGIVSGITYLDCRAFVQWSLYNGGFNASELSYIGSSRRGDGIWAIGTPISDVTKIQPGDIISTDGEGHIWLVVGVTDDGYYSAEEFGCNNGAVVNKYTWDNAYGIYAGGATAFDMSSYYNNTANVRTG